MTMYADEILSNIPTLEKDLVIETHSHTVGTNFTQTTYKPVKYIQIQRTELSDVRPKGEAAVFYSCRFLSFSEEEIKQCLEESNNDNLVPFVNSINFRKEEIEKQFRRAFDNLREARLITLIVDVFGKTRYIISEESIRDLIYKIWNIHQDQLDILRSKMNYLEAPDEIEKQWLERIFGKEEAGRIISDANLKRQSISRKGEKVKEVRDKMEYDNKIVEGFKKHVSKKYEKVIEEYGFPTDLIDILFIK